MTADGGVGEKLKLIREDRNLSIADLSQQSQCSADLIAKIENGELIPSLTPLIKLTHALDVRLGTLLDDIEINGPVVHRADDRERAIRFSGEQSSVNKPQLDFYALAQNKADRHLEPFYIEVHPLPEDKRRQLSAHEGEEFIYVLKGELEIFYGDDVYCLKIGDSIYLDSVVPHHVHAAGESETAILATIYEPR